MNPKATQRTEHGRLVRAVVVLSWLLAPSPLLQTEQALASAAGAGAPPVTSESTEGAPGEAVARSGSGADPIAAPASCLIAVPDGAAPEKGWPVFLLLHGYGTNKEDFDDLAAVVSRSGAIAIAIDAPEELGRGRRSWGPDIGATHDYIQEQIAPLRKDPRFDFEPIHVGGFSQGGIRSLLLAANYPDEYGGVLSVSPGGGSWPESPQPSRYAHPMRLVYGTADNDSILQSARRAIEFWKAWGQPWQVFTHPGGHQFPGDWVTVLGDGATWILTESAMDEARH